MQSGITCSCFTLPGKWNVGLFWPAEVAGVCFAVMSHQITFMGLC